MIGTPSEQVQEERAGVSEHVSEAGLSIDAMECDREVALVKLLDSLTADGQPEPLPVRRAEKQTDWPARCTSTMNNNSTAVPLITALQFTYVSA